MGKKHRIYGLMAGITLGFAIWGSAKTVPAEGIQTKTIQTDADLAEAAHKESDQDPLKLYAASAALIDADSGRLLYGKAAEDFRPMASTTKIMTLILALENGSLNDVCTVSSKAACQPAVHLGAPAGTEFYLKDLLYSLMLESHNDTAVVIAEHIGGSAEGFAAMMNQKARDIGCKDTWFITPNGLDARETLPDGTEKIHGTTAADLARILRYCIRQSPRRQEFLQITQTPSYTFSDVSGKRSYYCGNHNALLTMMDGALTGKTGFTGGAGYSYVGALKQDDRIFIIALLGCGWPPHKTYKWTDARTLFQYGMDHFFYRDVFEPASLPEIPVENGVEEMKIPVSDRLEGTQKMQLLLCGEDQVRYQTSLPERLEAPVKKGDVVGVRRCLLNGETAAVWPLYAEENAERWNFLFCLKTVLKNYGF